MFTAYPDPVFRRNLLVILAVLSQIVAFFIYPRFIRYTSSLIGVMGLITLALSGLPAALGIRRVSRSLGNNYYPWYSNRWAILYLFIAVHLINLMAIGFHGIVSNFSETIRAIPPAALIFELMASELLWTAVLEWPQAGPRRKQSSDSGPKQPRFKAFK
jgi:hypothetical protein